MASIHVPVWEIHGPETIRPTPTTRSTPARRYVAQTGRHRKHDARATTTTGNGSTAAVAETNARRESGGSPLSWCGVIGAGIRLSPAEVSAAGEPPEVENPIPVEAWVRFPETEIHVRGKAVAWSARAVWVEFILHDGSTHRAWASTVERIGGRDAMRQSGRSKQRRR